jgi:hypothetical protein
VSGHLTKFHEQCKRCITEEMCSVPCKQHIISSIKDTTGPGVHPASYIVGKGGYYPQGKEEPTLASGAEVKMRVSISPGYRMP